MKATRYHVELAAVTSFSKPFPAPSPCRGPSAQPPEEMASLTRTVLGHQSPGAPGRGGRRLAVPLGSVKAVAILPPLLLELLQPVHHVLVRGSLWWREAGNLAGYRGGGGGVDQSKSSRSAG